MSLCSCQYLQIYHIYLCGKKCWAPGTMGLMCRENWDGILSSTNVQRGFLPWWYIGSDSFYYSLPVVKKNTKQTQTTCMSASEEKNNIFDSFITTEVNRQLLIFLWNPQGKKRKKYFQHERLKNFSLLFLSLFLLQKEYIIEDFSTGCKEVLFLVYLICRPEIKGKKKPSNQNKKLALISEGRSSFWLPK